MGMSSAGSCRAVRRSPSARRRALPWWSKRSPDGIVVVGAHWGATALPGKPVAPQCAPTSHLRVWDNPVFAPDEPAMTPKNILHDAHRSLGAKKVVFGGWDMPLNYGQPIAVHHKGGHHADTLQGYNLKRRDITEAK